MTRQGRPKPKTLCTNRPWQELAWIDCQKEFFVVNTTVLSNKMYRDNPLAFWSETADNSLNWKLQPELNYPELPWKLQTTKLNYNYLEYRSKTAGNSLFYFIMYFIIKHECKLCWKIEGYVKFGTQISSPLWKISFRTEVTKSRPSNFIGLWL